MAVERMKATDFDPGLLTLFDKYVHGAIDRRAFLDGAGKYAVGGLTALGLLEMLAPNYAWAEQVPKDDKRIKAEYITYPSPQGYGTVKAYLVRPAGASGKIPGVVVVHENRGLNPYVEDVARRLGVAGFMAMAPDALSSLGGYPGTDEKGVEMQRSLDGKKLAEDFVAAGVALKARPDCTGRIGVVGFCYGGGMSNTLAVRLGSDLAAAVPFYGGQPAKEDVPKIKASLLIHYASNDDRINAGWPAYEAALKESKVNHQAFVYLNTNHGFHNDTTPRFDKEAAEKAWTRTVDHFNKTLKSSSS